MILYNMWHVWECHFLWRNQTVLSQSASVHKGCSSVLMLPWGKHFLSVIGHWLFIYHKNTQIMKATYTMSTTFAFKWPDFFHCVLHKCIYEIFQINQIWSKAGLRKCGYQGHTTHLIIFIWNIFCCLFRRRKGQLGHYRGDSVSPQMLITTLCY